MYVFRFGFIICYLRYNLFTQTRPEKWRTYLQVSWHNLNLRAGCLLCQRLSSCCCFSAWVLLLYRWWPSFEKNTHTHNVLDMYLWVLCMCFREHCDMFFADVQARVLSCQLLQFIPSMHTHLLAWPTSDYTQLNCDAWTCHWGLDFEGKNIQIHTVRYFPINFYTTYTCMHGCCSCMRRSQHATQASFWLLALSPPKLSRSLLFPCSPLAWLAPLWN